MDHHIETLSNLFQLRRLIEALAEAVQQDNEEARRQARRILQEDPMQLKIKFRETPRIPERLMKGGSA